MMIPTTGRMPIMHCRLHIVGRRKNTNNKKVRKKKTECGTSPGLERAEEESKIGVEN